LIFISFIEDNSIIYDIDVEIRDYKRDRADHQMGHFD